MYCRWCSFGSEKVLEGLKKSHYLRCLWNSSFWSPYIYIYMRESVINFFIGHNKVWHFCCICFPGEDTMTGDGGEYLRAEDLRELGDDSLPGHYLDGFNYMSHNLDRSETAHTYCIWQTSKFAHSKPSRSAVSQVHHHKEYLSNADIYRKGLRRFTLVFHQAPTHSHSPKFPSKRSSHWRSAYKSPGKRSIRSLTFNKVSLDTRGEFNQPADACCSLGVNTV